MRAASTDGRIHLSVPHMSGHEQKFVAEAFASNWLTTKGANIDAFERDLSGLLGGAHTLATSSGTAALHLILRYIGVGPGDLVAVPSLTFAGSVYPILYLGAEPVFVDSERLYGNIDPDLVEEYFTSAAKQSRLPKVLIVVHLYGQPAEMDRLVGLCNRFGVTLVEDAAESLGATFGDRQTGSIAPFAILSFNGNKMITTTGGGMVVTKDRAGIEQMRKWANQAREPGPEYLHRELGYNYRMSNVLAGIGRGQLMVLEQRVEARRKIATVYQHELRDAGLELQAEAPWGRHSRWLTVMSLDAEGNGRTAVEVTAELERSDIECRPVWKPMHVQPLFDKCTVVGGAVAEQLSRYGLCLPSSSSLTRASQARVIDALQEALAAAPSMDSR